MEGMLERAPTLGPVHAILADRDGETVAERHYGGPGLGSPANIKAVSKAILSALTGLRWNVV